MSVAVFTFVLLLGNLAKEILTLLVSRQASLWLVVRAVGLLIPFVLVFALPMGLLTATLLTFGRFSADNELTAVRASGISLLSLITPILILSAALSCVCAMINLQVAPDCRLAYKRLLYQIGAERLQSFLPERTYITHFKPYTVYFGRVRGNALKDVFLYEMDKAGTNIVSTLRAPTGTLFFDRTNKQIQITLQNASSVRNERGDRYPFSLGEVTVPLDLPDKPEKEPGLSELTFVRLEQKKLDLQRKGISTAPVEVQMHSQVAFSFACIGFTLIGIPLGIRAHRRETSAGIAMSLVLVMAYYAFLILGQSLETKNTYASCLIIWAPNFLFQAVGMIFLRRANRGA